VDSGPLWMNTQLDTYHTGSSRMIYEKGAYILEMLRVMLYESTQKNPEARFITMMRDFAQTYSGKNASTEDFQKMTEKYMGEPMGWFFDQWVYGMRIPSYSFSYQLSDAGEGKTNLEISLTQSDVDESFQGRLPLYIEVDSGLAYLGNINITGTKPAKLVISLPVRPKSAQLDPGHSILANIDQ
jgi:aminopeptidase N